VVGDINVLLARRWHKVVVGSRAQKRAVKLPLKTAVEPG